ncbi:MAG TPA: SPOR domain-containing protein [Burkholderiales bacterium]|nr:SPOR domain-containing protein [Burkholderiales bacterium]
MLIVAAIAGLAIVDRLRERPPALVPPHEPSQALITPPQSEPPAVAASADKPSLPAPPPPPEVINNEKLAPPPAATATPPASLPTAESAFADNAAGTGGRPYMIQVGVFTSAANAQALQKQLRRAGMQAHLETRVQLGPFKDKHDADKALARARKLGINAVLVGPR